MVFIDIDIPSDSEPASNPNCVLWVSLMGVCAAVDNNDPVYCMVADVCLFIVWNTVSKVLHFMKL